MRFVNEKLEKSFLLDKMYLIMIKLENVEKKYSATKVLNNVSFSAQKGEIVSVIGPSGCGKSTLLKCINGLERIDQGKIIIEGNDLSDPYSNFRNLRQKVGIVFQEFNLFPHLTVKQNVTLAPLKVKKMRRNDAEILAMMLLEKVGMLSKMDLYPSQLSASEAQRVAIARTLAMQPSVILFDEPTSSMDPKMAKDVLNVIKKLRHYDIIIILVTHELDFARDVSDRVVFLHNGRVIENGTAELVFNNPRTQIARSFLNLDK